MTFGIKAVAYQCPGLGLANGRFLWPRFSGIFLNGSDPEKMAPLLEKNQVKKFVIHDSDWNKAQVYNANLKAEDEKCAKH